MTRRMATGAMLASWLALAACGSKGGEVASVAPDVAVPEPTPAAMRPARKEPAPDPFAARRDTMVDDHIAARGVSDRRVLDVMRRIPRHLFVPEALSARAYDDRPLPIGDGQTISQPYIVALMTELVRPKAGERALDVGTGSGYQAAVLGALVGRVVSLEIVCNLADSARQRLAALGHDNVEVRCADGWKGAPDAAPFDVIIVAAAPEEVPPALVAQLAPGGRLVIPVGPQGEAGQVLMTLEKQGDGSVVERRITAVRFVPMTGGD